MWNCTHFRRPTDEQLRRVDLYFLATKMICSLSTLNRLESKENFFLKLLNLYIYIYVFNDYHMNVKFFQYLWIKYI